MLLTQLPTPALVLDSRKFGINLELMKKTLSHTGVALRPHYKSNKCSAIAHRQIESGAVGMTCAKLSEAEDLVFSGVSNVLIANQIVDSSKIIRAAELAKLCRLTVCAESADNLRNLSRAAVFSGSTLHVLIEYDTGMTRCGLTDPKKILELSSLTSSLPGLDFDGLQAYAGHLSHMENAEELRRGVREVVSRVKNLVSLLENNGIIVKTVSGGSTGTSAFIDILDGVYTELQAGSYIFMDSTYRLTPAPFENSLYVLSTVASVRPGLTILDVGTKGLGADQNEPVCIGINGDTINVSHIELNEEHLKLFGETGLSVGDKVLVIPGHCCTTVNLYDFIYLYENDGVISDRYAITARGRSV